MSLSSVRTSIQAAVHRHAQVPEVTRGMNVPYHRRGVMSIPAFRLRPGQDPATDGRTASLRVMAKAQSLPVDCFFYDLEDAAPDQPAFKDLARAFCIEALQTFTFGPRVVAFRPNNIRTPHFERDMVDVISACGDRLHMIVLPKTETAEEVADVVKIVADLQRVHGRTRVIPLEVLVESPRAFAHAERIAALPGVSALVIGSYDLARTLGGRVDPDTWLDDQRVIRQTLPLLAAAHGKDAVDGITATLPVRPTATEGISDAQLDAYLAGTAEPPPGPLADQVTRHRRAIALCRRDAADARRCGFAAKWILHPDQVEPVQAAFTPAPDEARTALKHVAAYAAAARDGSGAELAGQLLLDKAVVGADFWLVEGGLRAGVLSMEDVERTGFTLEQLRRTVRTRD